MLGGVAIWLAHAYAGLLARRSTNSQPLTVADLGHHLGHSWPVVTAAIVLALPLLL